MPTRIEELHACRAAIQSELEAQAERCVASAPHPYGRCQARYEKLQERLDAVEHELARINSRVSWEHEERNERN